MTDPQQESGSLDELFRKTFEHLPDTPDASGWDTPSDQVWQHVQANIQTPKSGWTLSSIGLVSALAVVLTVGLYLFFSRPASVPPPPAAETPATAAPADNKPVEVAAPTSPAETKPAPLPTAKFPKPQRSAPPAQAPVNSVQENHAEEKRPAVAKPLPGGSEPLSPNNTEKDKRTKEKAKDPSGH